MHRLEKSLRAWPSSLWPNRVGYVGSQEEDREQNLLSRPEQADMENKPTPTKELFAEVSSRSADIGMSALKI